MLRQLWLSIVEQKVCLITFFSLWMRLPNLNYHNSYYPSLTCHVLWKPIYIYSFTPESLATEFFHTLYINSNVTWQDSGNKTIKSCEMNWMIRLLSGTMTQGKYENFLSRVIHTSWRRLLAESVSKWCHLKVEFVSLPRRQS